MHSEYCNCGECEVRREKERTNAIQCQTAMMRSLRSEIREHKKALDENTDRVCTFISELQSKFRQDAMLASFYDDARKEFDHLRQRMDKLESRNASYGPVINDGQLEADLRHTTYNPPPTNEAPVDSVTPKPSRDCVICGGARTVYGSEGDERPCPCTVSDCVEIVCNGSVHYRRPCWHSDVLEAMRHPEYSVRPGPSRSGDTNNCVRVPEAGRVPEADRND